MPWVWPIKIKIKQLSLALLIANMQADSGTCLDQMSGGFCSCLVKVTC